MAAFDQESRSLLGSQQELDKVKAWFQNLISSKCN